MPKTVLAGLKEKPVRLSVICSMLDSGGSSGRLRKEYKINSPGDIRRSLLALSNTTSELKNLFNYRFTSGSLKGHNFANLLITAFELSSNNYERVLREIKKILNIKHRVLPATLDKGDLYAVLENGKVIKGETDIDIPKHNGSLRIKKVYLKPDVFAYPESVRAIKSADLIIIGPGDLFSSLAQILLTKGMAEAIRKSKAKTVYICNLMQKHGETDNFSVKSFAAEIEKLLGKELDYVIYNSKKPNRKMISFCKKNNPELLRPVAADGDLQKPKFIGKDLLRSDGSLVHDPKKLANAILSIK